MKKILVVMLALMMLVACGGGSDTPKVDDNGDAKKKIVLVASEAIGDNSLMDVMWRGVQNAAKDFDLDASVVELGGDATKRVPALQELAETEEYEIIVVGTYGMKETIEEVAQEFPNQLFLSPDVEIDFASYDLKNVISFQSAQNEGAYLGGALAAMMTQSDHEYTNPEKIIGFVGGEENPGVQDFLVGYIEGAKYVDADTTILFSFIGDWRDSAKAKELTLAQYDQGADIVFSVASQAGFGVLDASHSAKKFSLGVDMDQGAIIAENNPEGANHVLTSVQKNIDIVTYDLIDSYLKGDLEFGRHLLVGVKDDAMSLSDNEVYRNHVSEEMIAEIEVIKEKISSGEIVVPTAIGMSPEEVNSIKNSAGK